MLKTWTALLMTQSIFLDLTNSPTTTVQVNSQCQLNQTIKLPDTNINKDAGFVEETSSGDYPLVLHNNSCTICSFTTGEGPNLNSRFNCLKRSNQRLE